MMPVEVRFIPKGDIWLAECQALGVMTQGDTFDEARENLAEALLLFLKSCMQRGVLEQVLQKARYEPKEIKAIEEYAEKHIPLEDQICIILFDTVTDIEENGFRQSTSPWIVLR